MARPRTPPGPQPPPPVQRLRVRYAKRGRMRFSSTRDFSRSLERALRRAQVPMAYSAGFHPHPKISYANGAPTGAASEAEYFELALVEEVDPESVRVALDDALPTGLDILEVVPAAPGSLADRLQASAWEVELAGVGTTPVRAAVERFLGAERAEVTRTFKTGPKTFDVRGPVLILHVEPSRRADCAILRMVVRHTTPSVRPDDILTALQTVAELVLPVPPLVTRLAQGPLRDAADGVADPLAADEDGAGFRPVTRRPREPAGGNM